MWCLLVSVLVVIATCSRKAQSDVYHQPDLNQIVNKLQHFVRRKSINDVFYLTQLAEYLELFQYDRQDYGVCSILKNEYTMAKERYMAEYVNRKWFCYRSINVSLSENDPEVLYYAILVDDERDGNAVSFPVVIDE